MSTVRTILITATRQQALRTVVINRGPAGPGSEGGTSGPHAATHATGGSDPITPAAIGAQPAGSYATAAQGAKADTAIQPGNPALTDARTPTAHTHPGTQVYDVAISPTDLEFGAIHLPAGSYRYTSGSGDPADIYPDAADTTLVRIHNAGSTNLSLYVFGGGAPVAVAAPGTVAVMALSGSGAQIWTISPAASGVLALVSQIPTSLPPSDHKSTHAVGGADALSLADLGLTATGQALATAADAAAAQTAIGGGTAGIAVFGATAHTGAGSTRKLMGVDVDDDPRHKSIGATHGVSSGSIGSASGPAVQIGNPGCGFYTANTGLGIALTATIASSGTFWIYQGASGVAVAANAPYAWGGTARSTLLYEDAPNILALRKTTTAQKFRVYGTTTGNKYAQLEHDGTDAIISATAGAVLFNTPHRPPIYTVATAPATAATGMVTGACILISDALTPAIGSAAVTGGAKLVACQYNGTNWIVTAILN